ncbi:hypothetical protein [Streptomyces rapamycinicus]|uniref:Uncharacterized protein n=2 Tax=Streptomyces rapamycinicus TaxID=1226757 RepID=A0A0A0N8A6_STRRN|nr:hypothetical protein [Streptomyces rapamycinicus]AGP53381.1 hypothetical protein M271_08810 [Streptomyces rapamycinicus NRRL 5491]MBB4780867.1 hypothetical protein [Streptomyces rapamycinicus]RLV74486.1 hypothetical protein D3C57_134710 [Streptomyces rapamycinicus NRRL 5491]UTP29500.1 hypothetical protein LIV37_08970 [Streptomyces rapamycinicus NRRL 5491]
MTPRCDDGPEHIGPEREPDDPLAVILRPPSDYLGPPPGRYEAVRRAAVRRKLLRTAAGVGVSCAVAALIALPLRAAAPEPPARPTVPLAPPPATGRTTPPLPSDSGGPSASPSPLAPSESAVQRPGRGPGSETSSPRDGARVPARGRSAAPSSSARVVPSEVRKDTEATPGTTRRP